MLFQTDFHQGKILKGSLKPLLVFWLVHYSLETLNEAEAVLLIICAWGGGYVSMNMTEAGIVIFLAETGVPGKGLRRIWPLDTK